MERDARPVGVARRTPCEACDRGAGSLGADVELLGPDGRATWELVGVTVDGEERPAIRWRASGRTASSTSRDRAWLL